MSTREKIKRTSGRWWTPQGFTEGTCSHNQSVITIERSSQPEESAIFLPAPVDLHVHGGGGFDCMQNEAAIRGTLLTHAKYGTGSLLATSVTAPFADTSNFIENASLVMNSPDEGATTLLGVHLEGPFINPEKLGAQPPHTAQVDLGQLESWFESGIVRVITFAPELDPNEEIISLCKQYRVRPQIGHTNCSWQQAHQAFLSGCGVTHLYNAMSGVNHRDGGAATAALAYAEFAEIVIDGLHVDKAAFDAARRAIPKLYSVTDATAASGMPDGEYLLGSLNVQKTNNQVLLQNGTLAGSCLTQKDVVMQLKDWNIDWHTIGLMTSAIPAAWINNAQYGDISPGTAAHWLEVFNNEPVALWLSGQRYEFHSN